MLFSCVPLEVTNLNDDYIFTDKLLYPLITQMTTTKSRQFKSIYAFLST